MTNNFLKNNTLLGVAALILALVPQIVLAQPANSVTQRQTQSTSYS